MGLINRTKCKKKYQIIIPLLLILVLITGCGKQFGVEENANSIAAANENLIMVGVSQVGSESVWRTANSASVQNIFTKENGYFLIFDNARQKQENQIKAIRSFISLQVDYIVFSPITEEGWDTVLQEAKDAGIPVILMDRMVKVEDESLYTAWVGSDFTAEGVNAGEWLADYLEEEERVEEDINIVVLQGTQGATAVIGRTTGFDSVANGHHNWKILEQTDAEYTTAQGKEVMKRMLKKYPQIDVVVSQNDDMTFGAIEAINEAGMTTGVNGDIIIISFDAVKSALEMVQAGILNVDIECNPKQGEYIEKIIRKLEAGEQVDKYCYIFEQVFTKENVGFYIANRDY